MTVYLAFVRRTGARRYSATFPDLDGLVVHARGPRHLPNAAVVRVRQAGFGRDRALPPATALRDLPRLHDDADGYWLAVDLADALPSPADAMPEDGAGGVAETAPDASTGTPQSPTTAPGARPVADESRAAGAGAVAPKCVGTGPQASADAYADTEADAETLDA